MENDPSMIQNAGVSSVMKTDPVCIKVVELRPHYGPVELIELIWQMYHVRLDRHVIPRIVRDKSNRCVLCHSLFYAQRDDYRYCPNCTKTRRSDVWQHSNPDHRTRKPSGQFNPDGSSAQNVKIRKAGKFARVSSAWLYGRLPSEKSSDDLNN